MLAMEPKGQGAVRTLGCLALVTEMMTWPQR